MTQGQVTVREGRFGPYVTDGETNASLRKGDDVETITSSGRPSCWPTAGRAGRRKKKAAKKTPAKKTTAKKAPAKKAAAKKTAAKAAAAGHRRLSRCAGAGGRRAAGPAGAASFGPVAADYAVLRPGYPADAVAFLARRPAPAGPRPRGGHRPADRRGWVAAGHEVVAVDLSRAMLGGVARPAAAVATAAGRPRRSRCPTPPWTPSSPARPRTGSTRSGGRASSAACCGPGDVVGFVWNTRDERVPWVRALGELLAAEARGHQADQGVVDRFAAELAASVDVARLRDRPAGHPRAGRRGASPPAATWPPWTTRGGRRSSAGCATCWPSIPTPGAATVLELPYTTRAYRLTPR